jgi:D-beta-D-heptose 7-phosphate kinase/D-beta-D-heptose 1-phosphate adenosyltransferase
MIDFESKRLHYLFRQFADKTVLVVGDMMLDRYLWGRVNRISPEAPVPVVDVEQESQRFGGAANVCFNVHTLGARVIPVGIIGDDVHGETLNQLFRESGFGGHGLIKDQSRPTTVKTRIIAHSQQVVRTDREVCDPISHAICEEIMAFIRQQTEMVSVIILEDYNKGLLTPELIGLIIKEAHIKSIPVLVDPKYDNFFAYKGVTLFKPNRKEAADKMGRRLDSLAAVEEAGRRLLDKIESQAVLITLSEEGMALIERGHDMAIIPTQAKKVHDVSGAGDTVIATMGVVMAAGGSLKEAAVIANHAAGQVIAEVGIVPVQPQPLLAALLSEAVA